MGKTFRGNKGDGYEYWSKRPGKGEYSPNGSKFGKRLTHKAERQQNRPDPNESDRLSDREWSAISEIEDAPEPEVDPEVKVTKIGRRWHARLWFNGKVVDEMACDNQQDIGYISRTMLRWFDKCGGMSQFASAARARLGGTTPIGRVWYFGHLQQEQDSRRDD